MIETMIYRNEAYLYPVNGRPKRIKPEKKYFSLEELQEYVGGYIEIIQLKRDGFLMVVNEEGKLLGLPFNRTASARCQLEGLGHVIVGNAILCHKSLIQ